MPGLHARDMPEYLRKLEREIASARRAPIQIVGNAIEVIRVEQAERDARKPTAPIELTYQTATYFSGKGYPAVRFIMDFPDVTKATDGTDITIDRYELWGREVTPGLLGITTSAVPGLAAPGLTVPGLAATYELLQQQAQSSNTKFDLIINSPTSSFRADDFVPGSVWEFKARAIGVNTITAGNFSAVVTVQMLADTTVPPQPTPPVVRSERGQLVVTHDGQAVTGAMPGDMSYLSLAHGGDAQPTEEVARFGRTGGVHVQTGVEYYDPRFFRVRAIDESGNAGPWSAVATGYAEPMVDKDIILSDIDGAVTHLRNINAGVSILPDTIIAEHLLVTEDMTAKIASFLEVKADMIDVNDLWADNAFFGLADALLVRSDMFVGKAFEGGIFTTTLGGKFQTNPEDLKGVKIQETGIQAWNSSSGEMTFDLSAATGNMTATGIFQSAPSGRRVMLWDHGDGIAALDMYPDTSLQHGAIFAQPTPGGVNDGYMTSVQHYTNQSSYSASMSMYADGGWFLGRQGGLGKVQLDGASGSIFFNAGGGTTNDMYITVPGKVTNSVDGFYEIFSDSKVYIDAVGATSDVQLFADRNISLVATAGMSLVSETSFSIDAGDGNVFLRGRWQNALTSMSNQTAYAWKTSAAGSADSVWSITYPEPTPNGTRYAMAVVDAASPCRWNVYNQSGSGFSVRVQADAPANQSIRYMCYWLPA